MSPTSIKVGDKIPKNKFGRIGYNFDGWNIYIIQNGEKYYYDSNCKFVGNPRHKYKLNDASKMPNVGNWLISPTIYLEAQWLPHYYTIRYLANCDKKDYSGSMSTTTLSYNYSKALSKNKFTRTGYTFTGWQALEKFTEKWIMSGNSRKLFKDEEVIKSLTPIYKGEVFLYAQWRRNTFTVKYNANGGTGSMPDSKVTYGVNLNTRKNTFTRRGYIFKGWKAKIKSSNKWVMSGNTEKIYGNGGGISKATSVMK